MKSANLSVMVAVLVACVVMTQAVSFYQQPQVARHAYRQTISISPVLYQYLEALEARIAALELGQMSKRSDGRGTRSCDLNGGSSLSCDLIEGGGSGNTGGAIGGAGKR